MLLLSPSKGIKSSTILHQPFILGLKWILKLLLILKPNFRFIFPFETLCFSLIPNISCPPYMFIKLENLTWNDLIFFCFLLEIFGMYSLVWMFLILPSIEIPRYLCKCLLVNQYLAKVIKCFHIIPSYYTFREWLCINKGTKKQQQNNKLVRNTNQSVECVTLHTVLLLCSEK